MAGIDLGIDLGTNTVQIYVPGQGIVLSEPSVVAVNNDTCDPVAFGAEAYYMLGRTSSRVSIKSPICNGVISSFALTEAMLTAFIKRVCGNRILMPRAVVSVPSNLTDLERRSVCDVLHTAGARKICLVEEALAAALGAGIDISVPKGCMVVDIGGGTTDMAVLSINGMASSDSVKIAGNTFDESLIKFLKKNYSIDIGPKTAERIKREIGGALRRDYLVSARIAGKDSLTGMPKSIVLNSDDVFEAFEEPALLIVRHVQRVLEKTPPELTGDIHSEGIILTGGGALLYGMDMLLAKKTRLNVIVASEAQSCVVLGTGIALKYINSKSAQDNVVSPLDEYFF